MYTSWLWNVAVCSVWGPSVSTAWLQQASSMQMWWPALAAQRARPAATGLCPSLSTAFSVSFHHVTDWTAFIHKGRKMTDLICQIHLHISCPLSMVPLFPSYFSVDILLNRSQQLFASCTAKFADGQQCSIPVFDITHQTPLCEEHAKKMVSFSVQSKSFILGEIYKWERCLLKKN